MTLVPLFALALAGAAPDVSALRTEATAAYRAKRYPEACKKFGEAARLAPSDAPLAADLGLCLHRLGRTGEGVAETRRAIGLARGQDAAARRVRRSGYYNLALMRVSLPYPDLDACGTLPLAPGCDRPVHACTRQWSLYGTGAGESGTGVVVALDAASAREQREAVGQGVADLTNAGPPDDVPQATPTAALSVLAVEEWFASRACMDTGDCMESEEAYAEAAKCAKRKGCGRQQDPDGCLRACVADFCAKKARQREDCRPGGELAYHCKIVHADGCTGYVATVCEGNLPVHEFWLKATSR